MYASFLHPRIAISIVMNLIALVCGTVGLNHKASPMAIEVSDVRPNWVLTSKRDPIELIPFEQ